MAASLHFNSDQGHETRAKVREEGTAAELACGDVQQERVAQAFPRRLGWFQQLHSQCVASAGAGSAEAIEADQPRRSAAALSWRARLIATQTNAAEPPQIRAELKLGAIP
jgi:hypothetical protein